MDKKKRYLFLVNFFISGVAVIFISTALGTDYWVVASPQRRVDDDVEDGAKNVTDGELDTKFRGRVNIGLFNGYKEIDYGLGPRDGPIEVECKASENLCGFIWSDDTYTESEKIEQAIIIYKEQIQKQSQSNDTNDVVDHGLFNFGLWVCTIIFAALAICWGLVSMVFAAINAGMRPIETINGPLGLYVWNSIAAACSILCLIMYVVLYAQDLSKNVMSPEDIANRWTSEGTAHLDYSFYFIVIGIAMYLLNIIVLAVAGTDCRPLSSRFSANMMEKSMDGVMMY